MSLVVPFLNLRAQKCRAPPAGFYSAKRTIKWRTVRRTHVRFTDVDGVASSADFLAQGSSMPQSETMSCLALREGTMKLVTTLSSRRVL